MVSGENCMHEVAARLPVCGEAVCFFQRLRVKRAAIIPQGNHFYSFLIMLREDEVEIADSGEVETYAGKI